MKDFNFFIVINDSGIPTVVEGIDLGILCGKIHEVELFGQTCRRFLPERSCFVTEIEAQAEADRRAAVPA